MSSVIRRADVNDIPLLVELTDEVQAIHAKARPDLFVYPQDRAALSQHFANVLASENSHVFLLEADGQVAGHLYAEVRRVPASLYAHAIGYLQIQQIGVRADARGSGLGQRLMTAATDLARDYGLREIRLDYWSFNEQARRFYARNGFRVFREFVSKTVTSK